MPKPVVNLSGPCECIHLACSHARLVCPEKPVVMARQLGQTAKLCTVCADRWGVLEPEDAEEPEEPGSA